VRRVVGPDPVDQLIGGDEPVDVDEKSNENAALAGMTDVEALPVNMCLDIAE
jgi:hypothetical protein